MELTRTEILPGVWLNHLRPEKCKTACLSLHLLTQLTRENAAMNALIPRVLARGTTRWPDREALAARLEQLGAELEPSVRRIGEVHCLGFRFRFPEDDLPAGEGGLRPAAELLGQLLLSPVTRGGLLLPRYVDGEKQALLQELRSRSEDGAGYALFRCVEEMCCGEEYAVGALGCESECEAVNYKKLTRQYHSLLQQSPVEIIYCGGAGPEELDGILREALITLPRGEIDYEIGTDLRLNAMEEQPRQVEEELALDRARLVIGWRLGACMEDPDQAAILLFNTVFGGGEGSRLFRSLCLRLQLCDGIRSAADLHKGLLLVSASAEADQLEAVRDEILSQLEAMKHGEIGEEELAAAKEALASELRALCGSPSALEEFTLSQALAGLDYGPLELAALLEELRPEDLRSVALSTECDLIYCLRGDGAEDDGGEEPDEAALQAAADALAAADEAGAEGEA